MTTTPRYDCDRCGACCRMLLIEADAIDVLREPRIDDGRRFALPLLETTWVLNRSDDPLSMACRFVSADNADNACGIYATRPHRCVGFAAGSDQCRDVRRKCGLGPLEPSTDAATLAGEIYAELAAEEDA